jgi:hypothetical protein
MIYREHVEETPEFPYPTRFVEIRPPKIIPVGEWFDAYDGSRTRHPLIQPNLADITRWSAEDADEMARVQIATVTEYAHEAALSKWRDFGPFCFDETRKEYVRHGFYNSYRALFWSESLEPPTAMPDDVKQLLEAQELQNSERPRTSRVNDQAGD